MMRAKNLLVQPSESMSLTPQNGRILLAKSLTGRSVILVVRIAGKGSESKSRAHSMKLQEAYHDTGLMQSEKGLTIYVEVGPLQLSWAAEQGLDANSGPSCPIPSPLDPALAPSPGELAVFCPSLEQ